MLLGGNLSVVTTEKFEHIDEAISFILGLQNIFQIFTLEEYNVILEYRNLLINKKSLIDGINITFQDKYFDEIYPALDFFKNKFSEEDSINLSKKAEQLDKIVNISIRANNDFILKLGLYLTLAIAALSNGIINSIAFSHFSECNAKGNFHTTKEWFEILSTIYIS